MPARIPIRALRELAKAQRCRQAILLAWDGERTHVVTYGETVEDCDQAAQGGDRVKASLGWPATLNALPSRVRTLQAQVERLEAAISWALGEDTHSLGGDFGEDLDAALEAASQAGRRLEIWWWRRKLSQLARGPV